MLEPEAIKSIKQVKSPTKVFLSDASVLLFPDGFLVGDGMVVGRGQRTWVNRSDNRIRTRRIPLDSIAAMTYYELEHTGGEQFGSFLLGLFGPPMTFLGLYCFACPKCCFGSCPTVYAYDGRKYQFEAELFSYSISKYFQDSDLDRLAVQIPNDRKLRIRVSNEALETHYINQFSLLAVNHPLGTKIFPSPEGDFISTRQLSSPISVINSMGENVSRFVDNYDSLWYRSDSTMVKNLAVNAHCDWLDVKIDAPLYSDGVKLVFRLKNTLLSTILFYDVVLASQGVEAIAWTEKMNANPLYAAQFNTLYKIYAGIKIKVLRNGEWESRSSIRDVGPIAWKDMAVEIPLEKNDVNRKGELNIRLEFFTDNFMIDYIAYEIDSFAENSLRIADASPTYIFDDSNSEREDILRLIQNDDSQYLITNPGESFYFDYDLKSAPRMQTSLFIRSKGFYIEWTRGNWLASQQSDYAFNPWNVDQAISKLKESWLENRDLLEKEFFKNRIPLREGL
jgi:hypothetical protein